jgi:hypothetical protein
MKKSELRQLIKEELTSILKEKKTKQLSEEFKRMQKLAGIISESLEQDIIDFYGTLQDDADQSDGEYEAEWETEFFIEQNPEHKGKEEEINIIVKKLNIM